ncbi:MAG: nucleotide exchange factor GrpE [Candidatus Micrarchaeota archaeon]|nr:nucleotide exchange factor GrpE [Candidatus Micrarchaeota archaeon]
MSQPEKKSEGEVGKEAPAHQQKKAQPSHQPATQPQQKSAGKGEEEGDIDALEKKLSSLSESMLRLQAEFDNYKKRTEKEKAQAAGMAEARLMLRFIPVYEELRMAEAEAGKIESEPLRRGILLVLSKLRAAFEKEGLQEMKLEGEKFDPFRHEAAMHEESDLPEGTIVRAIRRGYLFRGEVLQHAIVSVSAGKKKDERKQEEAGKSAEDASSQS